MISNKSFDNSIYVKTIDNSTLVDLIEEEIEELIESYTHEDVKVDDGSDALPSITFANDTDTGIYRIADNSLGISTNGINRLNISPPNSTFSNVLRIDYVTGNSQFAFQLPDLTYDLQLFIDSNEDFHIKHGEFSKKIILEYASSGEVVVRPNSTAITNSGFCVATGDGVSSFIDLFIVNEGDIRSQVRHRFTNGSAALPSITFNNSTSTGFYRINTDDIGLTTGGALEMSWNTGNITAYDPILVPNGSSGFPTYSFSNFTNNGMYSNSSTLLNFSVGGSFKLGIDTSTDSLVLATHNLLFPATGGDIVISNQSDECIRLETVNEQISFEIAGNNKLVLTSSENISLQDIRINNGFRLKQDIDGSVDSVGGFGTLVNGKLLVNCNHIQTTDLIMVTYGSQLSLTNSGSLSTDGIIVDSSFVVESSNNSDGNIINWYILKDN